VIDIAGAAHLHGGEDALLKGMVARLAASAIAAWAAIADSWGGAHAFARYGARPALVVPAGSRPAHRCSSPAQNYGGGFVRPRPSRASVARTKRKRRAGASFITLIAPEISKTDPRIDDLTHEFEIPRAEKARRGKMAQIKPWKSRRNLAARSRIGLISSREARAKSLPRAVRRGGRPPKREPRWYVKSTLSCGISRLIAVFRPIATIG
jgi:hypothetical protein